jgi:hypothetical protein
MTAGDFEAISPGLPAHEAEVMAAHTGEPSMETQARTHGAGLPPVDLGVSDADKYC